MLALEPLTTSRFSVPPHERRPGATLPPEAARPRLPANGRCGCGSGARSIAADMPEACDLTVGVLALVAEQERRATPARTKAALAAAKAWAR